MKTVMIPVLQGVVIRNILRTDVLPLLLKSDVKLIFLVNSEEKRSYLQNEFKDPRIVFETVGEYIAPSLQGLFTFLKFNLLRTKRMDIRRKIYLHESRNHIGYFFKLAFNRIFARAYARRLVRRMDMKIVRDPNFIGLLEKHMPDLVVSAHPFGDSESSLIRQAKKRGIRTLGIINSWDKLTSRSILRVLPDKLIVHNEIVRCEAEEHADMDGKDIIITGVPHYDIFFNGKPRPREDLYRRFNVPLNDKIILFCPTGQHYSSTDSYLLNALIRIVDTGEAGKNLKIIVRFPPNDTVDLSGISHPSKIITYQPGIRFSSKRGIDWDMNDEDIQLLFDMIYWSAVVICPPSSLSIDAAVLDKPIINIKFGDAEIYSTDNINLYYESDHYRQILKHGGIRLPADERGLANDIREYINDPSKDASGRKLIAMEQCWKMDGRSSERMAGAIMDMLG